MRLGRRRCRGDRVVAGGGGARWPAGTAALAPLTRWGFPPPPLLVSLPFAGGKCSSSCRPLRARQAPLLPTAPLRCVVMAGADRAKGDKSVFLPPSAPFSISQGCAVPPCLHPTGGSSSRRPRSSGILLLTCSSASICWSNRVRQDCRTADPFPERGRVLCMQTEIPAVPEQGGIAHKNGRFGRSSETLGYAKVLGE